MSSADYAGRQGLGVFFRVPHYGRVKQRLAAQIGPAAALGAYESMVRTTFRRTSRLHDIDVLGFFEGECLTAPCKFPGVTYLKQEGADLGEKMWRAFETLFGRGYGRVVLMGTDSPDLPLLFVRLAFERLNAFDVAIGPSDDGGYYLIGMRLPCQEVLTGIPWGGPEVLQKTLEKARTAGADVSLLPPWYDIDDEQRLSRWRQGLTRRDW